MEAIAENSELTSFITDSNYSTPAHQPSPLNKSDSNLVTSKPNNNAIKIQEVEVKKIPVKDKEKRTFGNLQSKGDPLKIAAQNTKKMSEITSN